jgi:PKD repeat protein
MMRSNKFSIVSTTILMLLMLAVPRLIQANPAVKNHDARIRLGATQFTPSKGEKPRIPPGLAITGYPAGQRGYYILQFQGPVEQAWKDQVTETGAEILHYIPDFAFKVRMNPAQARKVEELESVTWVGFYHPAYKLSPDLKRNGTHIYTVRIERRGDVASVRAAIAMSGAKVLTHKGNILKVAADAAQLEAVAQVLDVAWVENFMMWEKHNEWGGGVIMGGSTADSNGYDGSSQIIAIADTGLGGGTINSSHPDIGTRVKSIHNWTGGTGGIVDWLLCWYEIIDDGSVDVDIGHGTHVALAALGAGGPSGEGRGTAPGAELIFQSVENFVNYYDPYDPPDEYWCQYDGYRDGYYLTGIPADIGELFQQGYDEGARVHSNSWGTNSMGAYTVDSANLDDFVWHHRDMTITYSAGNSGRDADGDGVVDSDSIGAPGTAKNVITVGASENDRQDDYPCDDTNLTYTSHDSYQQGKTCSSMGGNQALFLGTWGQRYRSTFPSDPIASDLTAGNAEQMAAWSSRGRTDDARIKPDVVAPGTWVLSGYSSLYQEGYGDPSNPQTGSYQWDGWGMPSTEWHKYMGGTSMSSPLVAGGAAVVRDFYYKAHGHNASAALVKATLINSAHDLLDENNDGVDDNHFPIPNAHEGWGRVDLANATDNSHQFIEETNGLQTGGEFTYQYSVNSAIKPFKVTLVWSDYPSTAAAWKHLVNNLNLVVEPPAGDSYLGNRFDTIDGWSITGGLPDKQNNVENVYVESPTVGTWTVKVQGYNVPYGPQPFALVVDGADFNSPPTASFTAVPSSGPAPLTVTFTSTSSDPDGDTLTYTWDFGDDTPPTLPSNDGTASYNYSDAGTYTVVLTVDDGNGGTDTASQIITVTDPNNRLPTASFTAVPPSGPAPLTVAFDASSSSDPDNDPLTYSWDFGDNTSGAGETTSHTYSNAGTYTAVLSVDDGNGPPVTASQVITVSAPPNAMHLENLSVKIKAGRWLWSMKVTATVKDASYGPVAGATVRYFWSDTPGSIYDNCVTNQSGECSVVGYQFRGTCLTFTVVDVLHNTLTYDPG